MRGYPIIVVLAAALAALAGCASIRESDSTLVSYVELDIGQLATSGPAVKILDIHKVGGSEYVPSSSHRLWLRKGDYVATLRCLRPYTDEYNADILKRASPADSQGQVHFTINYQAAINDRISTEIQFYRLNCATSQDGKPSFVVSQMLNLSET